MRLILRDTRGKKEILEYVFYGIKTVEFPNCVLYLVIVVFGGACLVARWVKNLPAMQETRVWCLGQQDPLEKEMATHSSIVTWRIPWTEESDGLQSMGLHRVWNDWGNKHARMSVKQMKPSFFFFFFASRISLIITLDDYSIFLFV